MALLHHPAMELRDDLNHIISLGFSGDFKEFFPVYYILDLIFIVVACPLSLLIKLFSSK